MTTILTIIIAGTLIVMGAILVIDICRDIDRRDG